MHFSLSFLLSSLLHHHQHALYSHLPSYAGESFDDVSMDSAVAFIMLSLYLGMDDPRGKYYASMAYNILKVEFPFPPSPASPHYSRPNNMHPPLYTTNSYDITSSQQ